MKKCVLFLALIPIILFSQEENRSRYGIYGGFGLNTHSAEFKRIPDCPSCSPGFKDGDGSGLTFGLVLDYPLSSGLYLSSKLLYKDLSGKLISTEKTTIIAEGIPTDGEFEHSLDATLGILGIEPSIKINLIKGLNLNIGLNFSYLLTKDYSQVEEITKPTDYGTFLNPDGTDSQSRERNKFNGTLQEANSFYIAPVASISYLLPLDKKGKLFLEPEVAYYYGISNIVSDELVNKWTVNSLTFGISLKYSLLEEKPKEEKFYEKYKIDTIRIEKDIIASNFSIGTETVEIDLTENDKEIITTKLISRTDTIFSKIIYKLEGTIVAVGVEKSGVEIENPQFIIEEYVSNRLDPLLNYVFFDENSSTLPTHYKQIAKNQIDNFIIDSLYQESTLDIYYNILNIVGKRMTENPDAKITLIGCNSDLNNEKGNLTLSEQRANIVKNYLANNWNVDGSRIKTEKKNLPEKASIPKDDADKVQENRRVEIYSDEPKILEPIFIEKIDRTANPPIIRFKQTAIAEAGFNNWEVSAFQKSQPENKYSYSDNGTLRSSLDWIFDTFQKIIPKKEEPINYSLSIEDKKGNKKLIENKTLTVDIKTIQEKKIEKIGDFEIERFSLILFDFDDSNIEGTNKKIVDFISSRIKPESEVEISGYTDRTGDSDYNKKLSTRRAEATKSALKLPKATVNGIGEDELLYNNEIPEGRFYCRTVNIIVKTKVK